MAATENFIFRKLKEVLHSQPLFFMEAHNLQCIILEWQHSKPDFWSAFWQRHTRNDWGSHKKWFSSGHSAYRSRIDKGYWRFSRLESWKREKKKHEAGLQPRASEGKVSRQVLTIFTEGDSTTALAAWFSTMSPSQCRSSSCMELFCVAVFLHSPLFYWFTSLKRT